MPIILPEDLPSVKILKNEENIFVMNEFRAKTQDIRPLRIAILNLMPNKVQTEVQYLRLLSNTPLQVDIDLVYTGSYLAQHTPIEYLEKFYKNFDEIEENKYDGMIITGAPVEKMPFKQVKYWDEMTRIMNWSKTHVYSVIFICWAAQAALYHFFDIDKHELPEKLFGVFEHHIDNFEPIVTGFSDKFFIPHSRHTNTDIEEIRKCEELKIVASSREAGAYIVYAEKYRQFFITGHSEYDRCTLKDEYDRDTKEGRQINLPENYYPGNNPENPPINFWRANAYLLASNWLNYYVYQSTPYDINKIS